MSAEKDLVKTTGASFSELREGLGNFNKLISSRDAMIRVGASPVPPPPPPVITITEATVRNSHGLPRQRRSNEIPGGGMDVFALGASTASRDHPFHTLATGSDTIRVWLGTVNDMIPTGMSLGDDPIFEITVATSGLPPTTGAGVVYFDVEVDANGDPIAVDIDSAATLPANAPPHYYHTICTYTDASGTLVTVDNLEGSQWFELCGGVVPQWGLV